MNASLPGRWRGPALGIGFALVVGGPLLWLSRDVSPSASGIAPEPDAGASSPIILEKLAILGPARILASEDASARVELTIIPKSELVAEDVDPDAPRDFLLGVLRTSSDEQPVPGSSAVARVAIHHHILPTVAHFRADLAVRRRAWLTDFLAWGTKETQREVEVMLWRDAAAGGPGHLHRRRCGPSVASSITRVP